MKLAAPRIRRGYAGQQPARRRQRGAHSVQDFSVWIGAVLASPKRNFVANDGNTRPAARRAEVGGTNFDIDARAEGYRVSGRVLDKLRKGRNRREQPVEILLDLRSLPGRRGHDRKRGPLPRRENMPPIA